MFFVFFLFTSLYTYDMRYLAKPIMVHMDHVSAVLDVDYAPTGKEFVSASFDKTIRIFAKDGGHSRSVMLIKPYDASKVLGKTVLLLTMLHNLWRN